VLFELDRARYERRSMLITANQPFENGARSPDQANDAWRPSIASCTTPPSLEMNVESYRRREALDENAAWPPATHATIKKTEKSKAD